MQRIEPKIDKKIYSFITVKNSVNSRKSYGGTSPSQVKTSIKESKKN